MIFLQVVIILLGGGVLTLLLWEPQVEGRNVHATQFEIYFKDPFLSYIYLAFVPFFVGLSSGIEDTRVCPTKRNIFPRSVRALRIIKYCALTTALFILGSLTRMRATSALSWASAHLYRAMTRNLAIRASKTGLAGPQRQSRRAREAQEQ